jgi:hypothetical protein
MFINVSDLEPLAYCIAIRDLLDFERFQKGFGDVIILRYKLSEVESEIKKYKNEILKNNPEFLKNLKTIIIGLLDKLYGIIEKYSSIDYSKVKEVQSSIKKIIKKINSSDLQDLKFVYEDFMREIFLKVYNLFNESLKKRI